MAVLMWDHPHGGTPCLGLLLVLWLLLLMGLMQ